MEVKKHRVPFGSRMSDKSLALKAENKRLHSKITSLSAENQTLTRSLEAEKAGRAECSRNGNRIIAEENRKVDLLRRALEAADRLADTCTSSLNDATGFTTLAFSRTALDKYREARSGGGEGG